MIDSSPSWKRRRFIAVSPMESELAKGRLAAAREKYGRDIRVYETSLASATPSNVSDMEETDEFYEFTAEDYFRVSATKKEDKYLKTKKIRDAEEAARRSRMTKAGVKVRFPDNLTLEASFHPSETMQALFDLLTKVVARPDLPFYLYTTPPKKQIKDLSQDFYSAGFVPGAIVYFAYEVPKGDDGAYTGPSLQEEVVSLQGLELVAQQEAPEPTPEAAATSPSVVPEQTEQKPSEKKKMVKPKWLKM
ncbi:plant UBX domain-containing protein 1 [Salvia miltiorrhiza]|uniref:plant UBX domain-containing protein 1 n=1 Tax=Salvia miltiorrhiza TaxID=226208 RepID=UPI0025ACFF44|nr:plant UBX domain-containing protein 1 [Salvia miltiorrhiza]